MRINSKLSAVALTAILSVAVLSGCAGGEVASDGPREVVEPQSVAEACTQATQAVTIVQAELSDIGSQVSSGNYSVVADQLGTLHATLADTSSRLGNPEVHDTLATLADKVGEFADLFVGVPDGDLSALTEKVGELQTVSQEVATAGQAMTDLCS